MTPAERIDHLLAHGQPAPTGMTAEQNNVVIAAREQLRIEALVDDLGRDLTADESQDQIDTVNRQLDPRVGIVAGDGNYYSRRGFPE